MQEVKFTSYLKDFQREFDRYEKEAVTEATMYVHSAARKKLSQPGGGEVYGKHRASKPGDPPAPDTGTLRRTVAREIKKERSEYVGRVGTPLKYGKMLERGTTNIDPRPWLAPTFRETADDVKKILGRGIK